MNKLYLYDIEDEFINYLSSFDNKVCDNKKARRRHFRKYIGVILYINGIKYLAPLSSPKTKDYETNGTIRKDPIFLTRIITKDINGNDELKGRMLISNMIPIKDDVVKRINPAKERDSNYQTLLIKELEFITKNREKILQKAEVIYKQKTNFYTVSQNAKYLEHTVDFKLLESVYLNYRKR